MKSTNYEASHYKIFLSSYYFLFLTSKYCPLLFLLKHHESEVKPTFKVCLLDKPSVP